MSVATFGLSADGWLSMALDDIIDDLSAALRSAFGSSIDLGSKSILGQITGILAERLAALWDLLEAINDSQDPDKATGAALDIMCALTGTIRPPASFSVVIATLTGVPTTDVPAGNTIATASTGEEFNTSFDATIAAVGAWAPSTVYNTGTRVTNNSNVYQCTVSGTSASSGGPTTVPSPVTTPITDNTVTWLYLGGGTGAVDVQAAAQDSGVVTAFAGDLIVKLGAVGGWTSVNNVNDAVTGRDIATDEELRVLRVAELAGDGGGTQNAIRAHLLQITGVLSATVFVNNTDYTDVNGMPPHSVEAMVLTQWSANPTDDQVIVNSLFGDVGGGIATYSFAGTNGTATDSQGNTWIVYYSRPAEIPIYVAVQLTKDPLQYPANGDALVAQAIATYGAAQSVGKDAVSSSLLAQAFSVIGVLDVTQCFIGTAPTPSTPTTVPISTRQLATYSTTNINVTSMNGTP